MVQILRREGALLGIPKRTGASRETLPECRAETASGGGLDGAYVHAVSRSDRQSGWFEVIVGKSINSADQGRYVALVHNYDQKPKHRFYEALKAHGLEADQPVSFFSDCEDTLHQLQMYLTSQSEYILDWFHITTRLTGMSQMRHGSGRLGGNRGKGPGEPEVAPVERQYRFGAPLGGRTEDEARRRRDQRRAAEVAASGAASSATI